MKYTAVILMIMFLFGSCKSTNTHLEVVKSVDLKKYEGKWYEIARLPNSFEEGLECVTAEYTLLENGKVKVLNTGYSAANRLKIETASGMAYIPDKNEPGKLKVTFFWPFYGNYWILHLDENYRFALVGDPTLKYLWILGRDKIMDDQTYSMLVSKAAQFGFDVEKLIKVTQDCSN
ncbi:MAG: lipocalin family protein [Bacteroidales bacterium]